MRFASRGHIGELCFFHVVPALSALASALLPSLALTAVRARQNSHAVAQVVIVIATPNSPVNQSVTPVFTVTRSRKPCRYRLCDACISAAGHTLFERRRSHAIGTDIATTLIVKQDTEYQVGAPEW